MLTTPGRRRNRGNLPRGGRSSGRRGCRSGDSATRARRLLALGILVWAVAPAFFGGAHAETSPLSAQTQGPLPADVDRCPFTGKFPVEIFLESPMHLRWLAEGKIDVTDVDGLTATAFVDDRQFAELVRGGYHATAVPNEARRAWQAYREEPAREPYHDHAALTGELQQIAADYPDITQLISIGMSVQNRELWAIKISDNAAVDEPEPEFKFSATMHGDEPVGTEMCVYLVRLLTQGYGSDPRLTAIVDDIELWIIPLHNPDGREAGTRYNAQGYDLNRTFPDPRTDPIDDPEGRPTEVQHMMRFVYDHNFILGGNYHGGALVVNYPWDTWYGQYTPDHTMVHNLALGYAIRNPPMYNSPQFPQGVTIGWEWYVIDGGMQDWSYHWRNEIHYTLEISNNKWPSSTQLPAFWDDNRESMLWLIDQARIGVEGYVTDLQTGEPINATVGVQEIGKDVWGEAEHGYYHRLLEPGTYTLAFSAFGYEPAEIGGVVVDDTGPTALDVQLERTSWYTVSGVVTEAGTGAPLAAQVAAYRNDTGELFDAVDTDPATGAYALDVPGWEYEFVASAEDHVSGSTVATIASNTTLDFELLPARGDVLLVLDNTGGDELEADLSALGYLVTRESAAATDPGSWDGYDLLIWSAGSYRNPVGNAGLRAALEAHAGGGGKLLIEGGEIGYDALENPGYPSFAANVLHIATWDADQAGHLPLAAGMGGHDLVTTPNALPTTIQLTYDYFGDQDACGARPEADVVYGTTSYPEDAGILVYDDPGSGEGQIVYYAFDYAALTSDVVARDLLENTLSYLLSGSQGVSQTRPAARVRLSRAHPTVTAGPTLLWLTTGASSDVRVAVHDASGRRVRALLDARLAAGAHVVAWDGRDEAGRPVTGGVYFVSARVGEQRLARRLVVVE